MPAQRRILLGVTAEISLILLKGFPEYLRAHGWDVHVVSGAGPDSPTEAAAQGVAFHSIPMRRQPSPLHDLRSLLAWMKLLRRVKPDVIFVGTPKAGLLGTLAGRLVRVPRRIYILRGLRLDTATGPRRALLSLMERITMSCAHEVIAVSPSLRRKAMDLNLVHSGKIRVLGDGSSNGVDLAAHDRAHFDQDQIRELRASLGLLPDIPVIGFVGRLTVDKGLIPLAEARKILDADGVDHQLLIVGGLDEGEEVDALHTLRSVGRPPIETGHVSSPAIYYHLMDALCLPTLREGFPNVVLEAAASGVPTVTTDATGAVDSVVDGVTGFIAETGNASSLSEALRRVLTATPVERKHWGDSARKDARARFSREDVWRRTAEYLEAQQ